MGNQIRSRARLDRRLYWGTSVVFFALVVWTFARTFYLKSFFPAPRLSTLLEIHGTVMTGWVVLLVIQTSLIASHRVKWHRQLGVFGSVWAASVVLMGTVTTLHAAAREVRGHTHFAAIQITITTLDLLQMLFFAGFVVVAIWQRNRIDRHKRLMLMTIVCMLPDALARLPVSFMTNQLIMIGLDLFIFVIVGLDTLWHRRLHPAFGWSALLFVGAFHLTLYFSQTANWITFAESLFA
jgi:hypothetical protein